MKPSRKADVRRARHARLHSIIEPIDLSDIEALFDDLGDAAEDAVRPAAQAAAQQLYNAAKSNVAALGSVTGNLASSIYQAFSKDSSGPGLATYHVSWNAIRAPHGGLVEYGHWQRYQVATTKSGKWVTVAKPENADKTKPRGRASRAEKDAYYMPRQGGPVYIPGKAFMRRALSAEPLATQAAADVLMAALEKVK